MAKVLVAMSGGVDSSATALLLQREGHEVAGITMSFNFGGADSPRCVAPEAVTDAARVCEQIGIEHFVVNAAQAMEDEVIREFLAEYQKGRTPNPCVRCNQVLKFGLLYREMQARGFEFLATGHYARIARDESGAHLATAADARKDQTYFLWAMPQAVLPHVLFPVADIEKSELRAIAEEAGLATAQKKESQDICFVPDGDYRALLESHGLKSQQGEMVTVEGDILRKHDGLEHYTIGQRKGLGIALGYPAFVVDIDHANSRIVVGKRELLNHKSCLMGSLNRHDSLPTGGLSIKIRSTMSAVPCRVSDRGERLLVTFDSPQFAVSPGQSAVLYHGDRVVCGGIMEGRS